MQRCSIPMHCGWVNITAIREIRFCDVDSTTLCFPHLFKLHLCQDSWLYLNCHVKLKNEEGLQTDHWLQQTNIDKFGHVHQVVGGKGIKESGCWGSGEKKKHTHTWIEQGQAGGVKDGVGRGKKNKDHNKIVKKNIWCPMVVQKVFQNLGATTPNNQVESTYKARHLCQTVLWLAPPLCRQTTK